MLKKKWMTFLVAVSLFLFVGIASAQEVTPEPTEEPPIVIVVEGGDSASLVATIGNEVRLLLVTLGLAVLAWAINLFIKLFIEFRKKYPREAGFILDAGDIVVKIIPGQMDNEAWAVLRRKVEGKETVQDLRKELNDR